MNKHGHPHFKKVKATQCHSSPTKASKRNTRGNIYDRITIPLITTYDEVLTTIKWKYFVQYPFLIKSVSNIKKNNLNKFYLLHYNYEHDTKEYHTLKKS
jgi:hypothetical protein